MLEAHEITKVYDGSAGPVRALDGVSLSVGKGEFVGVQGPSGCGKSTLLLACGGLLGCDDGQVLIDGQDPYALSPNERAGFRAGTVGFVFQQFHLVPYLTVLDNILSPTLARPLPDARRRAEELIAYLGLGGRMHHVPGELSTGERQRTALARALLHRPGLLLADEPTGNLDADSAHAVLRHLAEFAANGGAVLLVTHDDRAAGYARRTLRMVNGRLADGQ
ncbi:MAG TPA: ABC transporter ATP-binding protein [Phycisphaerae bacterium]|nr:ABC transporter ATP-binding protein [Phycisphaerae bacterium]